MIRTFKNHFAVIVTLAAAAAFAAVPEISNVTAKQRYPWNGLVDITCTVSGISGTTNDLKFSVAAVNSGNIHGIAQFWVVKDGMKSTDRAVHTNGTYHLVWDSKADFDNQICSNMVMRVNLVIHEKVQLWANGPFWATTNIGAEEPYESGYYFWWGDTVGYKRVNNAWVASDGSSSNFSFDAGNTPTYNKSIATLQSEGWITADSVLVPEHDAAHVHWGGNWRMPTKQELDDLNYYCDWTWTTLNGVNGYVVCGRGNYASNSIFLPVAGYGYGTSLDLSGWHGYYWSSVTDPYSILWTWCLYFHSGRHDASDYDRDLGQAIRPLQGATQSGLAGESAPFVLDNATLPSGESVVLPWNAEWIGGDVHATVVITDNGTEVKRATGSGEFTLNISCGSGIHQLEYSTFISGVKQGETYTAEAELAHIAVETKAAKAATCTEAGWTHEVKCSRCNAVLETSEAILAGHVRQTTISAIEPTCTTDGRTAGVVCSRCGATLETSEVRVALGHSGAITKPAVEATSSTAGATAEITCTRCGVVLHEQTTIPALGYIRNLTAAQLWPHRKIALRYELAGDINEVVATSTVPTVKGTYGSTTKTATESRVLGDKSCTPGVHHVVWDVEGDSITHTQSSMNFTIMYGPKSASTSCWVALSSSVTDGMSVDGSAKGLWHSPFGDGEVQLLIDGNVFLSSTNLDVFAWIPQTTGSHTLAHKSGSYTWTRTLTVNSLIWAAPPAPNPPTAEDPNIALGSTSKSFAAGGGSGTITTSGSGTWTATASDDWITFPAYSSSTAGRPVAYKVAASSGVEERTGYIYVSGHVFTITQTGVGAALDVSSGDFETDGGNGSFIVLADAQTSWKVRSNVDWISVTTDAGGGVATQGTGEAAVYFTVAPWNEVSTRIGTITAAGCTFTVNQAGRRMKISGPTITSQVSGLMSSFDYQSHILAVTVNALASTAWDVEVDASWLSVVDGGTGQGGGSVTIAINENPSWLVRSGTVRIGTETLTVKQAGRSSAALAFAISPLQTTASVKGANALISVMATPDLPWTAQSQANWLTVMPACQSGAGNGNVVYAVSPNPTMANRSGSIAVSAATSAALPIKTHTVSQPAATAMISADAHTFNAAGETFNVDVTTDDIVNWTIAEDIGWLSVVGSTSRIGPGSVSLVATENLAVDSREANMTIAGHPFTVRQKGRTVEVEYDTMVFGAEGGDATIEVHPDGNVTWVASTSSPDWIIIWGDDGCDYDDYGNVVGTGDHTIEYIVADYVGDGAPRTGTITIGDKTVYVTQRPYDLSINPSATTVGGNAGAGSVGVSATVGQIWNAIATEPWIVIESGCDSGTGSGTVRYTYTDNDTGAARSGKILIAGEAYTITQAARQMVAVNATARVVTASGEPGTGNGGVVSGGGTYDRGTSVTLAAVANDGYSFVNWTLPNGSTTGGSQLVVTADVDKEIVATFRRIPVYAVNGESVREGTSKTFTAPADVIDMDGTRKLVCTGSSRYPDKGTSFTLVVTEDIDFEWDLWTTNYLVTVEQSAGGTLRCGGALVADHWVAAGSAIDLTATPASGKSFFRWVGDSADELNAARSASAPYQASLIVNAPVTIGALFGTFSDTLATALDAPALTFTTGGDASWLPVIDATAQTGYTSARSGAIGAESETWLDTTVEGAGTLTFRWRVDCEKDDGGGATWDRLAVFTNGVEAARIDGRTGWQTVTINCDPPAAASGDAQERVPPTTTIRWSFYRDDFDEPGQSHENCGWVDGINFTKKESQ